MNKKKLYFKDQARESLFNGVNMLASAVVSTLGPYGRNVILDKGEEEPVSTKDGVSVAKAIKLENRFQELGARLVRQAAVKTAEQAGDGTTTSTLLAREIFNEGYTNLSNRNVTQVKKGIEDAVRKITGALREISKDVTEDKQLEQVAMISSNNDKEVATLISRAIDKVGQDGVITIEESNTGESYLENVEGIELSSGFKSPFFVTDQTNMTGVLDNPYILITDKRLNSIKELLPLLETLSSQNKSLLIVAEDIDGEALSTLVVNKVRGVLNVAAVKAPGFGDRKKENLEDLAVLTGGKVVTETAGMRLDRFDTGWLGTARKVTITKDKTTVIDGIGSEDEIQQRILSIKTQIDNSKSPYEIENLQERLGKIIGGVAVVYVGGSTDVEISERKDRVEDALFATRAALEEGILPGGGIALARAASRYFSLEDNESTGTSNEDNPDFIFGQECVYRACFKPFMQIVNNSGISLMQSMDKLIDLLEKEDDQWTGATVTNSGNTQFVNMFDQGIIDPTKVTRLALENAASVAGVLLTTECVIVDVEDETKESSSNNMMF